MRRLLIAPAALAFLLAPLAAPAVADHGEPYSQEGACGSDGEKTLGMQTATTPAGTFYLDFRGTLLIFSGNGFWLYQETNKIQHLQRVAGTKADTHIEPAHPNNETCTDYAGANPDAEGFKPDRCIN